MVSLSFVGTVLLIGALVIRGLYRGDRSEVPLAGKAAGKTFLVTGGNTGLGLATVRHLMAAGAKSVIITVRDRKKGEETLSSLRPLATHTELSYELLDLNDLTSVRSLVEKLLARKEIIDALILNAGVMIPPYGKTKQGIEQMFGVNHVGHFAFTIPLLEKNMAKRVVVVSSSAATLVKERPNLTDIVERKHDADYSFLRASEIYSDSKLCNLLFVQGLRKHFPQVEVVGTHPGWTVTDLQRHTRLLTFLNLFFPQEPSIGALSQALPAFEPFPETPLTARHWWAPSGFRELTGNPALVATAPELAADEKLADELWALSEKLIKK